MLGVERLDGIMEMLKDGQAVSIHTLSKTLYISESTLRRDLAALQKEGLIRRIRGGAILAANNRDVPRLIRENEAPDIKNIIGARAAELVHPGDVILLDPSTTCSYMVPYLPQHTDLLAITSGLKTALALSERHIRTMVTGGTVMDNAYSMVGNYTEPLLRNVMADTLFFSCRGVGLDGRICGSCIEEIDVRRMMAQHARKIVFMVPSHKIGREYFYTYGSLADVDEVICDEPLPATWREMIGRNRK